MKIAYIAPSAIPSETANSVQVMKVCQALTQLGYDTTLMVPGTQTYTWEQLKDHYGLHTSFPIRWLPTQPYLRKIDFAWASIQLVKKININLVYTRLLWVAVLALQQKLPVILELHEVPGGRFSPWLYKHYLKFNGIKLTVFITHALKKLIETSLNVRHKKEETLIAPDGVDLERFEGLPSQSAARSALGLNETFTAVYSGGFYPGRGLESLFDLAKAFPQVQFIWVGGKPTQVEQWQNQLNDAGLMNVKLTGYVPNNRLPLYQTAADVLLMPYSQKVAGNSGGDIASVTSPMKLFEYMASGRAILTSDLPVLHEVLNESNASFYPPDDLQGLIHAFAKLQKDTQYREAIAIQAKMDVKQYSWKERMKSILEHFILIQAEQNK